MLVTVYESRWMPAHAADTVRLDPTRMAQGIMTGIGFLGAGVIFKEGLSVRGLTTAASIWVTAAIGILIGIGFYFPAGVTAALVIFTLSVFRWIETRMPMQSYARLELAFARERARHEAQLRSLLASRGFNVAHVSCRLSESGQRLEYRMMVRTSRPENFEKLAAELLSDPDVSEFRIAPTGD
jgi:putative Mg2+ transporter-C (MgtC) family protein